MTARWLIVLAVLVVGCGSGDGSDAGSDKGAANRIVDTEGQPPVLNALDIDPKDGAFLLTTNKGFFRISPDGRTVEQERGEVVVTGTGQSTVGTFLEITVAEDGEFLGSGHPDSEEQLPPYLGFIRSSDQGKTWSVVSRLGEADLHQIRLAHQRLYAFDAVLGAILISDDGGKTWAERFTPRSLVLDFVVDPGDPEYLLISTDDQLFRSSDEGRTWRPLVAATGARLAWLDGAPLFRADRDGSVRTSTDRGRSWVDVGRVKGEPYKLKAVSATEVSMALIDGSILKTSDGGKRWSDVFRP